MDASVEGRTAEARETDSVSRLYQQQFCRTHRREMQL